MLKKVTGFSEHDQVRPGPSYSILVHFQYIIPFLLILLFISSCYEPIEGCTDIEAVNYEGKNDEACDDCCRYPNLELSISQNIGENTARRDQELTLDSVQYFKLLRFRFFMTQLKVISDGQVFGVRDSISVLVNDNGTFSTTVIEDNIDLLGFNAFTYDFGETRTGFQIDSVSFVVGLANPFPSVERDTLVSNPLFSNRFMYDEISENYLSANIILLRDTTVLADTVRIEIPDTELAIPVKLENDTFFSRGISELSVKIRIDYAEWLKGIDFAADSEQAIQEKIVQNTSEAFSIIE